MHFGERIRQAREIRGWTQDELAHQLGKSKSLIAQIEAGFRLPSRELLESVAVVSKLPITFFNEEPHLEFAIGEILFRAQRTIKRKEVLASVRQAEHLYAVYAKVAAQVRAVPVRIPDTSAAPAQAAREVKTALELPLNEPVISMIRPLERAGVVFLALPQMSSGDAFSIWANDLKGESSPVIAYAAQEAFDRTRLSIAHELGHIAMHKAFLRKPKSEVEEEAFAFGAEWLMPEAAMRSVIKDPVTLTSLSRLKPIWGVSLAALIVRAYELQMITQRQYHYLFQQLSAKGWKLREPQALDIPAERPKLLMKMVETVYGKPIDYVALSNDTRVSPQELRGLLRGYEDAAEEGVRVQANVIRFAR